MKAISFQLGRSYGSMRKEMIATGIIVIVVVSIMGVFFFLGTQFIPTQRGFQFERNVTPTTPKRIFFSISAEDTDLSVSFIDDDDLLYSIDITPHENSTEASIIIDTNLESWGIMFATGQQESVDITLGNGCFYNLQISGDSYLNTTVVYSNNAWVNGTSFGYFPHSSQGFDGHLTLRILDDIITDGTTGFIGRVNCDTLNLEVDVPDQWGGIIDFNDVNVTFTEISGWAEQFGRYKTENSYEDVPLIDLNIEVEEVIAKLTT